MDIEGLKIMNLSGDGGRFKRHCIPPLGGRQRALGLIFFWMRPSTQDKKFDSLFLFGYFSDV